MVFITLMGTVQTVCGGVDTARLGATLMHEHIFVLSTEVLQNYPGEWGDEEQRIAAAAERINQLNFSGIDTIVDLTVIGLGRYIPRIQRIAERSTINIIVATGIYTYNDVPQYFHLRGPGTVLGGPEIMVEMFVRDIDCGIAGTGVRAGILKCATDEPGVTPGVERVLRAVAQAHRQTGVPISTHTHARSRRGLEQQKIFRQEGVDLTRVIIGHSGDTTDLDYLQELAANGSYLGMDRFGIDTILPFEDRVNTVAALCERGLANRMVISHDANCFIDWIPEQAVRTILPNWHYMHIHNDVIPALKQRGVTDEQIHTMLVANPRAIFETQGATDMTRPFDMSGITRGSDGISRYDDLPASLIEMLRATVESNRETEAIVEIGGPRINYGELWDRAARVAGGLREQGIAHGDRVAIRLGNGLDWCLAFWGGLMAGAIVVPVNTRFSGPEVEYVLTDSGSKFVFLPEQPLPDGKPYVVEGLAQPDVAAIFYTSGTTGFPKGAMTTHEGFLTNVENCNRVAMLPRDGSVRSLVSVPLFHVTGCNSQLLPCCASGAATVIMPHFDVQAFLRAITAERINSLTSVPAIYWYAIQQTNFLEVDTRGIQRVSYGGAPIAPDLVARILDAFPNARVGNGFGLTETSSVATFLPHEYARLRPETVGFAAPVCDLELFEPDSEGVGELLIRGPNIVKGYWNKPEATANTFVGGWLHTGDLARLDGDGFVQIVDRKKDMVNRGGENVYCVEVENALASHPAVFETAVMGVPDPMMGEKVGAIIVLKPGAKAGPADIRDFLRGRLADFKIPQYMIMRSEPLPRNPGGKILKAKLRREAEWGAAIAR